MVNYSHKIIITLGWGAINGGHYTPFLQYADMNFIPFGRCMELYYNFQDETFDKETGMCLIGNDEESICRCFCSSMVVLSKSIAEQHFFFNRYRVAKSNLDKLLLYIFNKFDKI